MKKPEKQTIHCGKSHNLIDPRDCLYFYDADEIDTYLSSIADVERIADIVGENSSFKCLCRTVGGVQYTCDRCKECEKIAQEISDHIKGNK